MTVLLKSAVVCLSPSTPYCSYVLTPKNKHRNSTMSSYGVTSIQDMREAFPLKPPQGEGKPDLHYLLF